MSTDEIKYKLGILKGKLIVINNSYITQEDLNLIDFVMGNLYLDFADGSIKLDC